MYRTQATVVTNRSLARVFAAASDVNRFKDWQEGLIESRWTSEGAPGIGATYLFVSQFGGTQWDLPGEVTRWDPPHGWEWRANGGPFPVKGGFRIDAGPEGTRITMFSESEPRGWMNLMRPVLKWMGERMYRRSLTRLKAAIESADGAEDTPVSSR